jgi:hypothetical protein
MEAGAAAALEYWCRWTGECRGGGDESADEDKTIHGGVDYGAVARCTGCCFRCRRGKENYTYVCHVYLSQLETYLLCRQKKIRVYTGVDNNMNMAEIDLRQTAIMICNGNQARREALRRRRHHHAGSLVPHCMIMMTLYVFIGTASAFQTNTNKLFFCSRTTSSHKTDTTELHYSKNNDGALQKAYNDNALFNFHMMTQAQKIRDYSAMDTFVDTKSLWNSAWHDSFVRNGLADFVPPMTGHLNVLVIGGPINAADEQSLIDGKSYALDGDDVDTQHGSADLGSATVLMENIEGDLMSSQVYSDRSIQHNIQKDSSCSFLSSIFDNGINTIGSDDSKENALEFTTYDVIMDEGLIADLVQSQSTAFKDISSKNKQDVARLLLHATKRIREMGIYVANTSPMTLDTKEYLENLGEMLGLQWEFDLDGISDENSSVSVARKFGSCPNIGWQTLARMLNE